MAEFMGLPHMKWVAMFECLTCFASEVVYKTVQNNKQAIGALHLIINAIIYIQQRWRHLKNINCRHQNKKENSSDSGNTMFLQ